MEFIGDVLGSPEKLSALGFALRTILVGLLLWVEGRILPHRSGGQFAGYDFAFFWMMGGITAAPLFEAKINFLNTVTVIIIVYLLHYLVSYLAVKNRTFATWLMGQPIVLIDGGKVKRENMTKALFPLEILLSELRINDAPNLNEVDTAVLETSGHVSVLKKADFQPVTPNDINITTGPGGPPVVLINDGVLVGENLAQIGHDEDWLVRELQKNGIKEINDAYIAIIDSVGLFYCAVKS